MSQQEREQFNQEDQDLFEIFRRRDEAEGRIPTVLETVTAEAVEEPKERRPINVYPGTISAIAIGLLAILTAAGTIPTLAGLLAMSACIMIPLMIGQPGRWY